MKSSVLLLWSKYLNCSLILTFRHNFCGESLCSKKNLISFIPRTRSSAEPNNMEASRTWMFSASSPVGVCVLSALNTSRKDWTVAMETASLKCSSTAVHPHGGAVGLKILRCSSNPPRMNPHPPTHSPEACLPRFWSCRLQTVGAGWCLSPNHKCYKLMLRLWVIVRSVVTGQGSRRDRAMTGATGGLMETIMTNAHVIVINSPPGSLHSWGNLVCDQLKDFRAHRWADRWGVHLK